MKELVEKINAQCAEFAKNAEAQVVKGNKAAGARARKAALELMKDLKEFRKVSVEVEVIPTHCKPDRLSLTAGFIFFSFFCFFLQRTAPGLHL